MSLLCDPDQLKWTAYRLEVLLWWVQPRASGEVSGSAPGNAQLPFAMGRVISFRAGITPEESFDPRQLDEITTNLTFQIRCGMSTCDLAGNLNGRLDGLHVV